MILADFRCPVHGVFEMLVDANADSAACPCGAASPWTPSPVAGRVRLVEVTRGPVEKPPTPRHYNTETLGEGQRYSEWRAARKAMWREVDRKERKERAG